MSVQFTVEELLLDESFISYCQQENSANNVKWDHIIQQYPGQQKVFAEARELFMLLSPQLPAEEIAAELAKMRNLLEGSKDRPPMPVVDPGHHFFVTAKGTLRRKRMRRLAVYAVVVIIIGAGLIQFLNKIPASTNAALATTYHSGAGERKELRLQDGSTVILNSNSTVTLYPDFGEKQRRVQLAGEAFFQVAKDQIHPFIVTSDAFSTTAVGTAFYINGRHSGSAYKVTLLEGKVKLGNGDYVSLLNPGEEASWSAGNNRFITDHFDTAYLRQWISGRITFNKTPVAKAFSTLQDWYGMEIEDRRVEQKNVSLNGDYTNQPLEDILKVICFSLSCQYTISGNKIVVQ